MANRLKYFTFLTLIASASIFADLDSISPGLGSLQGAPEYLPEEKTQKSITSTFLYLSREQQDHEDSKAKYSPGIRLEGNFPFKNEWEIDVQAAYSQFSWKQSKTYEQSASASSIFNVGGKLSINGVEMNALDLGPSTTPFEVRQSSDITFYDFSAFFGKNFSFKGFSVKPVAGGQCISSYSHVRGTKNATLSTVRIHNGTEVSRTEAEEEIGSISSKNRQILLTPAIGIFFNQVLYRAFSLAGFAGANLAGDARGSIGCESSFAFKSRSRLSLGMSYEAQRRAVSTSNDPDYFSLNSFNVYGFSVMGRFDF